MSSSSVPVSPALPPPGSCTKRGARWSCSKRPTALAGGSAATSSTASSSIAVSRSCCGLTRTRPSVRHRCARSPLVRSRRTRSGRREARSCSATHPQADDTAVVGAVAGRQPLRQASALEGSRSPRPHRHPPAVATARRPPEGLAARGYSDAMIDRFFRPLSAASNSIRRCRPPTACSTSCCSNSSAPTPSSRRRAWARSPPSWPHACLPTPSTSTPPSPPSVPARSPPGRHDHRNRRDRCGRGTRRLGAARPAAGRLQPGHLRLVRRRHPTDHRATARPRRRGAGPQHCDHEQRLTGVCACRQGADRGACPGMLDPDAEPRSGRNSATSGGPRSTAGSISAPTPSPTASPHSRRRFPETADGAGRRTPRLRRPSRHLVDPRGLVLRSPLRRNILAG